MGMVSSPLVSIIVPIYNVEKYLVDCLDSIVAQTYNNLEIILVDDCSSDLSGEISDSYASKDNRIRVIHKPENGGLYSARLTGLNIMKGDYFATIDSDDYVDRRYIAELVQAAMRDNLDVVTSGGLVFVFPDEIKNYPLPFSPKTTQSIGSGYYRYVEAIAEEQDGMRWSMCGRLFKTSVFTQAKQYLPSDESRLTMAEDLLTFSILVYFANIGGSISAFRYYYRQNEESTLSTKDPQVIAGQLDDVKLVLVTLKSFIKKVDNYEKYRAVFEKFENYLMAEHEYRATQLTRKFRKNIKLTDKPRILCPSPFGDFNGGGEKSSYVLWKWLNKFYDVIIMLPSDASDEYIKTCQSEGLSYVCGDYMHGVRGGGKAVLTIYAAIEEFRPAIIFPSLYFEDAFWAAAQTNIPAVFLNYGLFEMSLLDSFTQQDDIIRIGNLLKLSNVVVANSLQGVDTAKQYGRDAILSWSYTEAPAVKLQTIKKTRLIYPARISEGKRQIRLVEGVEKLVEKGINIQTILLGADDADMSNPSGYLAALNNHINTRNLSELVKVLPWKSNPWQEFGVNDIYVTTTDSEAVGRATLEAVGLGIPILIPDIPGHREYREVLGMSDEHFYIPSDMDDFARRVAHLVKHLSDAKTRAGLYQKKAAKVFSEDACNKKVLSALEGVIGKGNPGFYAYNKKLLINDIVRGEHVSGLEAARDKISAELNAKNIELSSYLGVKRSVKLAAGNIKRRLRYGKER